MSVNLGPSLLPFSTPYVPGSEEDYVTGLKQRFKYSMQDAMTFNPVSLLKERSTMDRLANEADNRTYTVQELREQGILPGVPWNRYLNKQGRVNSSVVDALQERNIRNLTAQKYATSAYSSFTDGSASLVGALAGGLRDPVNIALGLIPVYGVEATLGRAAMGASPSILRAFGARFITGAAEDMLINGTLAIPFANSIRSQLGDNPTLHEYLQSVAVGGLIGGGFRGIGGLMTDPSGRTLAQPRKVAKTEVENRIENMTPQDVDAALIYTAQADARGVDLDMDSLLELSDSFTKSTISRTRRDLAEDMLAFKSGLEGEPEVTVKGAGDKVVAETTIKGVKYSAKAATGDEARALLNKRIESSINNRILPRVTENADGTFTAQYVSDRGVLQNLMGHGRSEVEAIRNLHRMYDDAMAPNKKIKKQMVKEIEDTQKAIDNLNKVKKDIEEGKVSRYGEGGKPYRDMATQARKLRKEHEAAKAAVEAKYREDYANAKTPSEKANLTKAFKKQTKELDAKLEKDLSAIKENADSLLQDNNIRRANAENVNTEAFADGPQLTEAEFNHKINELMTHRNEKLEENIKQSSIEAKEAFENTKTLKDQEKYAKVIEDRITASEAYNSTELKDSIADFEIIKRDTDILNSKKMDDIFNAFNACERGL